MQPSRSTRFLYEELKVDRMGEVTVGENGLSATSDLADRLEHIVRTNPNLGIAIVRQLARMAAIEDERPRP